MTTTYYLSSLESARLEPVRRCEAGESLVLDSGKPAVLARIDPPVIGQDFGRDDIDTVLLTARHEGATVDPVSEYPLFVFVAVPAVPGRPLVSPLRSEELEIIGWGELYRTGHDAVHHVLA